MSTIDQLSILACQIDIPVTNDVESRNQHLANCARKVVHELDQKRSDLVVLPELSSIDYSRESFDKLDVLAEELEGLSFQTWQTIARQYNTTIAYSFARKNNGNYYISVAVVNPDGDLIGHYDKIHLAQYGASMEKEYFTRGKNLFYFELNGLRLAPIICYDIRIPELSRTLSIKHNVDVILHCGAYYRDESFYSWHQFSVTRAMENQVYLLSLNRAGTHYGNSVFCAPWVDEHHPPIKLDSHAETFTRLMVNKQAITEVRENYSFRKDLLDHYSLS